MTLRTKKTSSSKEVWIGLALVKQRERDGALGDADQAYVNVLAPAMDGLDFRAQVKQAVKELQLTLIRLDDAETMKARLSKHHIHKDLRNLAKEAERTGLARFDIFQTFDLNQ